MRIQYMILSPTGNITVLVFTPVPREAQPALAAKLLAPDCLGGEQVGFVETATDARAARRLQMMGGEFCGNATMSLAAVLAREAGWPLNADGDFLLEVSGSRELVPCHIHRGEGAFVGTMNMPVPELMGTVELPLSNGSIRAARIDLPGITHLVLPASAAPDADQLRELLPRWNQLIRADALGALLWDAEQAFMDPLVYVPSTGTLVREHGCGSGSAAIGCWLARRAGRRAETCVRQPGGDIYVDADYCRGRIASVSITGLVEILAEGELDC